MGEARNLWKAQGPRVTGDIKDTEEIIDIGTMYSKDIVDAMHNTDATRPRHIMNTTEIMDTRYSRSIRDNSNTRESRDPSITKSMNWTNYAYPVLEHYKRLATRFQIQLILGTPRHPKR